MIISPFKNRQKYTSPSTKNISIMKVYAILLLNIVLLNLVVSNPSVRRTPKTLRLPFFGPVCNSCPPHFCDDDPAVVNGYCCGCARFFDHLPVRCGAAIACPLNNYDLCESYEYMLHCCCATPELL